MKLIACPTQWAIWLNLKKPLDGCKANLNNPESWLRAGFELAQSALFAALFNTGY
jgi:hypothetical protein